MNINSKSIQSILIMSSLGKKRNSPVIRLSVETLIGIFFFYGLNWIATLGTTAEDIIMTMNLTIFFPFDFLWYSIPDASRGYLEIMIWPRMITVTLYGLAVFVIFCELLRHAVVVRLFSCVSAQRMSAEPKMENKTDKPEEK